MNVTVITTELRKHVPFTAFGTVTGVIILTVFMYSHISRDVSFTLFWVTHPLHVLLSALVTTAMYRLYSSNDPFRTIVIGYIGSVGIATISDSVIPFMGEWLLDLPNRGLHLGFIEKWWLVNPLAIIGIILGYFLPHTKIPHAGHVLLSTWASLFHIVTALGTQINIVQILIISLFLFLAVWIPCCTSDIVFPLLFIKKTSLPLENTITIDNKGTVL
ncbi:MAG: hypothetical protein A4E71_02856 [Smithella sp. PtaU1.Bin162]|nr:MAG: hypothetical protein A4E71_02856 [Smithella sp. PtaU1.Bin162]